MCTELLMVSGGISSSNCTCCWKGREEVNVTVMRTIAEFWALWQWSPKLFTKHFFMHSMFLPRRPCCWQSLHNRSLEIDCASQACHILAFSLFKTFGREEAQARFLNIFMYTIAWHNKDSPLSLSNSCARCFPARSLTLHYPRLLDWASWILCSGFWTNRMGRGPYMSPDKDMGAHLQPSGT